MRLAACDGALFGFGFAGLCFFAGLLCLMCLCCGLHVYGLWVGIVRFFGFWRFGLGVAQAGLWRWGWYGTSMDSGFALFAR